MWKDLEAYVLSVTDNFKKFLTVKSLQSKAGYYIYIDIRAHSEHGPTIRGICVAKCEFSIIANTLVREYPLTTAHLFSGRTPIFMSPSPGEGVMVSVENSAGRREILLTSGEIDQLKRLWPKLKIDFITKYVDSSVPTNYIRKIMDRLNEDNTDSFGHESSNVQLEPMPLCMSDNACDFSSVSHDTAPAKHGRAKRGPYKKRAIKPAIAL